MIDQSQYYLETLKPFILGLEGLNVIHSESVKDGYAAMRDDDLSFDYENIQAEDAQAMVELLELTEVFFGLIPLVPQITRIVPMEIMEGMGNVKRRIGPWRTFLRSVSEGVEFNREKAMLKIVAAETNKQFLHKKLG